LDSSPPPPQEAFSQLPPGRRLEGAALSTALARLGLDDSQATEEELQREVGFLVVFVAGFLFVFLMVFVFVREVAELEREVDEQEEARDRLQQVQDAAGARLVRAAPEHTCTM
jgi:hypothetical protein